MTRLLDVHRRDICSSMVQDAFAERKQRLAQEEHALAMRLVRDVCGENVFAKIAHFPEGWLPGITRIGLEKSIAGTAYVNFSDRTTVPNLMQRAILPTPEWEDLFRDHRARFDSMERDRHELADLIGARLRAIYTKEKLASEWPEAVVFLREPPPVATLPAVPIEAIMERIARAKAA